MQYSRLRFVLIVSAGIVIAAGYGPQPSSSQAERKLGLECDHAAPPPGTHWVCSDPKNPCNCRLESDKPGGSPLDGGEPPFIGKISTASFEHIMNALAAASSEGNPKKIADFFTENALYSDLTGGQTYRGQAAVAKLFQSSRGPAKAATVEWHHLLFNEQEQIGAGEFTRERKPRRHGMVIVKVENGRISNWREYRIASNQSWQRLTAENQF